MKQLDFLILLVTIPLAMFTPGKSETTKEIEKNWNVDSNTKVILHNKYGKMDIKTWDRNEVDIKIVITVKTKDKDDAEKVFDRIKINFSEGSDYVKAETEIEKKKSGYFDWIFDWTEDDYSIDWLVYMPKENDLNLNNKYGNTFLMEMDGNLDLEIKYGDLTVKKSNGNLDLELGYGNSKIDYFSSANVDIKYSEIDVVEGVKLKGETKYSDIDIKKVKNLILDSKYDDISFGKIGDLKLITKYSDIDITELTNAEIESKYTEFEIKKLYNNADFDLDYGELEIDWINSSFDNIEIKARYSEIELKLEDGASYNGDFIVKYGEIKLPTHFTNTMSDEESNTKKIKGYLGNSSSSSSITIKSEYDDIIIK